VQDGGKPGKEKPIFRQEIRNWYMAIKIGTEVLWSVFKVRNFRGDVFND
jgi:hypothetical protein